MNTEQDDISPIYDLENQKLSDTELLILIFNLTGRKYTFANGSHMRWGTGKVKQAVGENPDGFFQLMPEGSDGGFFDWYCDVRTDHQFFKSRQKATLQFIYYWLEWKKAGKPST